MSTSGWTINPELTIQLITTNEYKCTWLINDHQYDYTTCDGWISDEFFLSNQYAIVGWNLVTNAMYTQQVAGQSYNSTIAMNCAKYAVQTVFPGGDLGNVDIR